MGDRIRTKKNLQIPPNQNKEAVSSIASNDRLDI